MGENNLKIALLSGKGGTGKTFLSVNLATVAKDAFYIDCDVEEPNGALFLKPTEVVSKDVTVQVPFVNTERCNGCRTCVDFCKFNAIALINGKSVIFEEICHSCGGCVLLCPEKALTEKGRVVGEIQEGVSGDITVLSGLLKIGEESGVPIINELLNEPMESKQFTIIDCPPGSACNVMDSMKDADYCVIVAEPTSFGAHNLKMIYQLVQLFNKPHGVVINKDLQIENETETFCVDNGIKILAKIPFDKELATINSNAKIAVKENEQYVPVFTSILQIVAKEVQHERIAHS